MRRSSTLKYITRDEMLVMRTEQNMSNHEIAKALDCSYDYVLNMIGKQPSGMPRKPRNPVVRSKPEEPVKEETPACLVVTNRMTELTGTLGAYLADFKDRKLIIWMNNETITVKLDDISQFITELQAIQRKDAEIRMTNEMW